MSKVCTPFTVLVINIFNRHLTNITNSLVKNMYLLRLTPYKIMLWLVMHIHKCLTLSTKQIVQLTIIITSTTSCICGYIIKYSYTTNNSRDRQGNLWLLQKTYLDK